MNMIIDSISIYENESQKNIDVVVDIMAGEYNYVGKTWVSIPYDEKITIKELQETALKLARQRLVDITKSI